ncbi:MAG TPA: effector-associated domain EAD1-containing protein [Candidatus Acidoferrales bacterium]|jgi:hypothetical protein|nr:effector-associated domain EAD1-containing protein [Candidatus Acidoferrales bacterium]
MTGPEIVQFAAVLNHAFTFEEVSTLLLGLDRKLTDYVTGNLLFPKQLEELVGAANSQAWIPQLVIKVVRDRPNNASVKQFLASYPGWDPAKSAPWAHPSDALRVFGGKSFIGREDLRKFLKGMCSADGKNVLLVLGEHRKIGKTYSKELVAFLSYNQQPSRVVYLDLDNENYSPARLAADIGKRMRLDVAGMPGQGEQQATRWNQDLSTWLIPEIPQPDRMVWWIILDGFRQRMPSEELQDLIAQIAQRTQSTQDYKLILVDYNYALPVAVSGFMFKEKVTPLEKTEVQHFLAQVHQQQHGAPPADDELSEYLSGVYEKLAEYTAQFPEMAGNQLLLNMAVTDAFEIIREG